MSNVIFYKRKAAWNFDSKYIFNIMVFSRIDIYVVPFAIRLDTVHNIRKKVYPRKKREKIERDSWNRCDENILKLELFLVTSKQSIPCTCRNKIVNLIVFTEVKKVLLLRVPHFNVPTYLSN